MAKFKGNGSDNAYSGTNGKDKIDGKGGDDTLFGLGGKDHIKGGDGNDVISGGTGDDKLYGGDGDDLIDGGLGDDKIKGDDGNDTIMDAGGDDDVDAGDGNNTVLLDGGDNKVKAKDGDDLIETGGGDDKIDAGDGDNIVRAGDGENDIKTKDGDDLIESGAGEDKIDAGDGDNTVAAGGGDDKIKTKDGNDFIDAGDGDDEVKAGAGDDTVFGAGGDDTILGDGSGSGGSGSGGSFNDYLDGGAGNDWIVGAQGEDTVFGGAGDDILFGDSGGSGSGGFKDASGSGAKGSGSKGKGSGSGGKGSGSKGKGSGSGKASGSGDGFADYLDGGAGDDFVIAGGGNDEAVYTMSENAGATDDYRGGHGIDTLTLNFTYLEWLDPTVQSDIADYLQFLSDNTNPHTGEANSTVFHFSAFDLAAREFENLRVFVDGVELNPEDEPVAAQSDAATLDEDASATVFPSVLANDLVPDLVKSVTLVSGPAAGVLVFNEGVPGAPDGSFSFDPAGDFEDLAVGESRDVDFVYEVTDADDDTDQATVTITVTGRNDAPDITVAMGDSDAETVAETDSGLTIAGTLTLSDVDTSDLVGVAVTSVSATGNTGDPAAPGNAALLAMLSLAPAAVLDGTETTDSFGWTFNSGMVGFDYLAVGESFVATYEITATDDNGATDTQSVTVTITGTNDAPIAIADDNADDAVAESGVNPGNTPFAGDISASGNVLVNDTDVDTSDVLTVAEVNGVAGDVGASVIGTYGSVVINADGSYTYTLDNADEDTDALAQGAAAADVFAYTVSDGNGGTDVATLTITIIGTNDGPVITSGAADASGAVAESGADADGTIVNPGVPTTSGTLTSSDVDAGATAMWSGDATGTYGSIAINAATGTWTYTLDNADGDTDALAAGDVVTESFTMTVMDDEGATADETVTITITGTNDAPVITSGAADASGAVAESGADADGTIVNPGVPTTSGTLTSSDVDAGATAMWSGDATGTYGSIAINAATGTWTYTLDNADGDTDALAAGDVVTESFTMTVTDDEGATADETVTITITGTNDAPVAAADSNAGDPVIEKGVFEPGDPTAVGSVLANDTDVDATDILSVSGVSAGAGTTQATNVGTAVVGTYGSLTLSGDGSWLYTLDDLDPDTEALAEGQVVTDLFTYEVSDANGGTDTATVTITITGSEDNRPPVANDDSFTVDEDVTANLAILGNDTDVNGDTIVVTTINGTAVGAGDTVATTNGTVTLLADGTVDYLANADYSGSDSFTYATTDGLEPSNTATVDLTVTPVADAPSLSLTPPGGGGDLSPVPSGTDVQVNTTTSSTQLYSDATALDDGGWLVTWSSFNQDGNSYGIYSQRYDASGAALGGETQVNTFTSSNQIYSDATALEDGGWLVTWASLGQDGSGYGIYSQRYDASGAAVGGETLVNTFTSSEQIYSDATALDDGGWLVTWSSRDQDGSSWGIYSQRYDASGAAVGGETQVNTFTTSNQLYSEATALEDGGWLVTWSSVQDGSDYGIYSQRYDAAGNAVGGETQVNTFTSSPQVYSDATALEDGGWLVTWSSFGQDGSGYGIYSQRYDAAGNAVGGETQVNTTTSSDQLYSDATALDDGGWLVTWSSLNQDGSGWGIYSQRYDAMGNAVGGETQVNETTAGDQFSYGFFGGDSVATLADGRVVTVYDQDFGSGEIFYVLSDIPAAADGIEDQPLAVGLAAALSDTDGSETLAITLSGFPAGATFNLGAADGSDWVIGNAETLDLSTLEMTPPADWNGTFTLTAVATATETANGDAASTTVTADYTIAPVNDLPEADDDSAATGENAAVAINVLANDVDVDGDTLAITSFTQAVEGAVTLDDNGTPGDTGDDRLVYTPGAALDGLAAGDVLNDIFSYTISDGNGGTDTAIVEVVVTGENDAPVAVDDSATTGESAPVIIDVLGNDSDIDGSFFGFGQDVLSVSSVTQGSQGAVSINGDGTVTYTPSAVLAVLATGDVYNDSFSYTLSDGKGGTDVANVDVSVTGDGPATTTSSVSGTTPGNNQTFTLSLSGDSTTGDGTADLTGTLGFGAVVQPKVNVIYVIDVSGSTVFTGSFLFGQNIGDVNSDGVANTVLDAQILSLSALTDQIKDKEQAGDGFGDGNVTISTVTFEQESPAVQSGVPQAFNNTRTVTFDGTDGTSLENDADVVNFGLAQLRGNGGTNFQAATLETLSLIQSLDPAGEETNVVVFLSDGEANDMPTSGQIAALQSVAQVNAIGVGPRASLSQLNQLDNTGGAVQALDTNQLSDAILGSPIPDGSVIEADVFIFDGTTTTQTDVLPFLVDTQTGLEVDFSAAGLEASLASANEATFVVGIDDDENGTVDLTLSTSIDIFGIA